MKKSLTVLTVVLFLGSGVSAFAGATALSQLPAVDKAEGLFPAPVIKAETVRLDFRINQMSKSGFSLGDYSQAIQVNGYKDFDGDFRFSGTVDQKSFFGSLTRNSMSQDFTYEMGATKLLLKRYAIHYEVTGFAAGANGVLVPVDMLIRGGIRGQHYEVSEEGLCMTSSKDSITGSVSAAAGNKQLVASLAAIMASLQLDEVLGVVEVAGNYPNPFRQGNGTTLTYTLLQPAASVRITIYDAYGKVLQELDGNIAKGENRVFWDGQSNYNDDFVGRKILIWQLEIYFSGTTEKVIKQFTMNAR